MTTLAVQVGSTITNGSSALRVTERVDKDPRWGTSGWRGTNISLEAFGGNTGTTGFVPDYLLTGWYHVPFEWRAVIGGGAEERYVWQKDYRHLIREVRPTFPRKPCDQREEHDPHLWEQLHIPTGNPLVEYTQWWQCGDPLAPLETEDQS